MFSTRNIIRFFSVAMTGLLLACSYFRSPQISSDVRKLDEGRPKLIVPEPLYDFGSVWQGTSIEHTFLIRNVGAAPLDLKKVTLCCGCEGKLGGFSPIPAGASIELPIRLRTGARDGQFSGTIEIETNDPLNAKTALVLKGWVEAPLRMEPKRMNLGRIMLGEKVTKSLVVLVSPSIKAPVIEIETSSPDIKVSPPIVSGNQFKYKVTVLASEENDDFLGHVEIRIAGSENIHDLVYISSNFVGDLEIIPNSLSFGFIGKEIKTIHRNVRVVNRGSDRLRSLRLASNISGLSSTIRSIKEGREFEIELELDPSKIQYDSLDQFYEDISLEASTGTKDIEKTFAIHAAIN